MAVRYNTLAALLLVLLLIAGCGPAKASEGIVVKRFAEVAPPAPPTVNLVFVGDIMLARIPGDAVAAGTDPFADWAKVLQGADLSLGNLECVIATVGQRVPKAYNFRCHPQNVPLLAKYFDAVSVANNHSGDFGKDAFAEELNLLKQGGLAYFGGGKNLAEAHQPVILEKNGLKIAILGYNEVELRSYEAGATTPGLAWSDDAQVKADVTAARKQADLVVVYPHWGLEYQPKPSARQRQLAQLAIDAGADLVVGAHPHVTQTVEWYKDRLVVYSLGNYVFDDFMDVSAELNEPSRTSWVLRVTIGKEGIKQWDTLVARTDDQGIPRRVLGAASPCGKPGTQEIASCKGE